MLPRTLSVSKMIFNKRIRTFAVTVVWILVLAHSYVYLFEKKTGEYCQCCYDPSIQYSFDNLTMISHREALKIRKIWEKELLQFSSQGNRSVIDQTIEAGGQPERILVVSTWRSGSSYVGYVVSSRPGTHYFYEPLFNSYEEHVVRGESEVEKAVGIIHNLFHCRDQEGRHITKLSRNDSFFIHNPQLMKIAKKRNIQWDPTLVTVLCRRSPVLAMKTVRLLLRHASTLLENQTLSLKVVYLIRNPQETIRSRLKQLWCPELRSCADFSMLCSDLVEDFNVAQELKKKYPQRFMVLHYEDLLTRSRTANELARFLGLTKDAIFAVKSPYRELEPRKSVSREFLNTQYDCSEAMKLWGYITTKSLLTNLSTNLK